MGKPTNTTMSNAPYRDDPDAVSMHTTRNDYDYDDMPELPSYDEVTATSANMTIPASALSPRDEYAIVQPGVSDSWRVSSDVKAVESKETTIRMDERLNDPDALCEYITNYLRVVPPRPKVRLRGWHQQTVHRNNKKETERVTDFDIVVGLQAWLPTAAPEDETHNTEGGWRPRVAANSDTVHRGSWRKTKAQGHGLDMEVGRDLVYWCNDYCDSTSKFKVFRVTRDVVGMDQQYLRTQLEHLIRSTNYRGHIDLSFPLEEKHVDIYNPHLVNRWRTSWVRYIFYFTFLWLFTWPILFFMTSRWNVYRVDWCFSFSERDGRGHTRKRYASISEQAWFERHANFLRSLVMNGHQGDATHLPLDIMSGNQQGENVRLPRTGNHNVDAAVNFIHGGVNAWNALSGSARGDGGWGGDV